MFATKEHNEQFEKQGYLILPLLDETAVKELTTAYIKLHDKRFDEGFHATIWHPEAEYKECVHLIISQNLKPVLFPLFKEPNALYCNFHVKMPGVQSELDPHQDWSFVNEPEYSSVTCWLPLCDVTAENGCLQIVPGSHRLRNYIRGRFFDHPFQSIKNQIAINNMMNIELKAGEGILFNSRMIHGSPANLSGQVRIAVSMVVVPAHAPVIHHVLNEDRSTYFTLEVTPDFFRKNSCFDFPALPVGQKTYPMSDYIIDQETINAL